MRNAFADELLRLAGKNDRLVMLSGDIGNRLFDEFKRCHGARFFNCGVAEANMVGVAAGMAMCGLRPVAYTITPFITARCLEQIRIDVCYHDVPVVLVGVGGGLSYAGLGATHHACDDVALLRVLPGMTILCPGDPVEVRLALRAAIAIDGPVYLRLGKKGEPVVHRTPPDFHVGRAITLSEGRDVALLSTGIVLPRVVEAAERLRAEGLTVRVVSFPTVKPLDEELLWEAFLHCGIVCTVEEHSLIGGFGAAVAEWRSDRQSVPGVLLRIGTPDEFLHESGSEAHARASVGLDVGSIVSRVLEHLRGITAG